ncbi:TPA: hypothetical protein DEP94_00270, partial [Candidatus Nomurabacteria bacterium]|nr:hypothetical protein [Candidatus Nomurabacteria bacterium]
TSIYLVFNFKFLMKHMKMNYLAASRWGILCHPRLDLGSRYRHWIPAFARMTQFPQQAAGNEP